ncbi:hypothetical protein AMJ57_04180 [Parcubacteria bacterium SG8_24]|nr:MAG: hypothetical protein AMJ57_04180 [Parcubacteria bacterium SG8_24]
MNRLRSLLIGLGIGIAAAVLIASIGLASQQEVPREAPIMKALAAPTAAELKEMTLGVDQRLIDVAWLCWAHAPCDLWVLTTVMDTKDRPQTHLYSNGSETRLVREQRDGGTWQWEKEADIVELKPLRRLTGASWRCFSSGPCDVWYTTRIMRDDERPRSYVFTDGERGIIIRETPGVE